MLQQKCTQTLEILQHLLVNREKRAPVFQLDAPPARVVFPVCHVRSLSVVGQAMK